MATSIGQYTPAFLPGEPPSLTEKPGRPQSTLLKQLKTLLKQPCMHRRKTFFACGSSAPVRAEHEGGTAGGDPAGAMCAGTRTVSVTGVMALSESLFQPLVAGDQKASLGSLSP